MKKSKSSKRRCIRWCTENHCRHLASRRSSFYGHYDVQPAEPLELWTTPAFEPTVRDGNLFGRGTADDKGQVHIHLKAIEASAKRTGKLPINVKVMVEGEEEVGSVNLWDFVPKNERS